MSSAVIRSVTLLVVVAVGPAMAAAPRPHVDRFGDPLPSAAVARLGSTRFRCDQAIYSLAVSPDGKWLAAGTAAGVQLLDAATGRRRCLLLGPRGAQEFLSLAFSADGRRVLAAARSGQLCQWDARTGKALRVLEVQQQIKQVAWSPGRRRAVVVAPSGLADVWDLVQGKHLLDLAGKVPVAPAAFPDISPPVPASATQGTAIGAAVGSITGAAIDRAQARPAPQVAPKRFVVHASFSPNGRRLALGVWCHAARTPSEQVEVVDAATGKGRARLAVQSLSPVPFTPDGKHLLLCTGSLLQVHEASSGRLVRFFTLGYQGGDRIVPLRDGRRLAVLHRVPHLVAAEREVRLWDLASGKQVCALGAEIDRFADPVFAPDGRTVYTAGSRGLIRAWDTATGKERQPADSLTAELHHLCWTADGRQILTASGDCVRFWEARTGRPLRTLGPFGEQLTRVQISNDGRLILTWGSRRPAGWVVRLIDVPSGKERPLPNELRRAAWVALSPDGKWLAGQVGTALGLWDVVRGKRLHSIPTGDADLRRPIFSPDGRYLAFDRDRRQRELWDLGSGWPRLRLSAPCCLSGYGLPELRPYCFSADSRTFRCLDHNGYLRLYETATGAERACRLLRQRNSPPPPLIHTRSRLARVDGRVQLWPLDDAGQPIELPGQWDGVWPAFSPDGRSLATASSSGSVVIWDTDRLLPWPPAALPTCKPADLEGCWAELFSPDARAALAAIEELAGDPERTVPFLARRLHLPADEDRRIARLCAELDSDDYAVRRRAETGLRLLGQRAEEQLRRSLAGPLSLHARRSIERLLKEPRRRAEQVALIRAVEVLERCRAPAARALLERLQRQKTAAWFRREVRAALAR